MGQAWRPPVTNREFRFWISQHAVERFRERVEEEFRARTDRDLAMLLDERIYHACVAKHMTEVIDAEHPDIDTKIVTIESRKGERYCVVMRPYRVNAYPPMRVVGGPEGTALAAITVLTQDMAASNYSSGRWYVPNRPFADKLKLVQPAAPAAPAPAPTPPVAPAPPTAKPRQSRGGSTTERMEYAKAVLRERPGISVAGPDGLAELVRKRFGVGMSNTLINQLRDVVAAERPAPSPVAAPVALTAAPPVLPQTPLAVTPAEVSTAMQLAQAIDAEKMARTRKQAAERELSAAQEVLTGASSQVEKLLQQMQQQRGVS